MLSQQVEEGKGWSGRRRNEGSTVSGELVTLAEFPILQCLWCGWCDTEAVGMTVDEREKGEWV